MVRRSSRKRNTAEQAKYLKAIFQESSVDYSSGQLKWKGSIQPSPIHDTYQVKLFFKKGKRPKVKVVSPKLIIPKGKKLPHVYSKDDLCLYYPDGKEWNEEKFLVKTIVPWVSEWLYHYEIWLVTGDWNGGGLHPKTDKKETIGK